VAKIKKLDLLLREIDDKYIAENFYRIQKYLEALSLSVTEGPAGADGATGPQGPQGPAGASGSITLVAGETLSALKFVYVAADGFAYRGSSTSYTTSQVIGITITAASVGNSVTVATFGEVVDGSFSFGVSNPIFLTTLGSFSTTPPASGHVVKLGHGLDNGKIFVDIDETIIL